MSQPSFVLRNATPHDLAHVKTLLQSANLPLDGLEEQFGDGYAIAECDGVAIGTVGIEVYGEAGLLRSAVVDAAWQGRGVGDALTRDRIAWAASRGLSELWLLTTTAADYFPRFGFEVAHRDTAPVAMQQSQEFAHACPASAISMRRPLS